MKLEPRYDGPVVVTIDDEPASQLPPLARQWERFQTTLGTLTDEQWGQASRCEAWTVRDVVAHLVSVTGFWNVSVAAGLAGEPTRWLVGFDPAATPPQLVDGMAELSPHDVLDQFVAGTRTLIGTLSTLTDEQWELPTETPAGHVPIRLLAQHALWDSWIHERDVILPLGREAAREDDEIASCLRFAAAVGPVLGIGVDRAPSASETLAVEGTDPDVRFFLEVGGAVAVRSEAADGGDDVPCLRGDAVELTEALSLRQPLPSSAPDEWRRMLGHLEAAFDAT